MKETGLHVIVQAFLSEHACHASVESLAHGTLAQSAHYTRLQLLL